MLGLGQCIRCLGEEREVWKSNHVLGSFMCAVNSKIRSRLEGLLSTVFLFSRKFRVVTDVVMLLITTLRQRNVSEDIISCSYACALCTPNFSMLGIT